MQKKDGISHPTCLLLRSAFKRINRPIIIGIAGDSGSGKTTYSNGIRRLLGKSIVKTIHMDGYHTENRKTRAKTGHLPLNPACNNLKLFKRHLSEIKQGKTVKIPIYDHKTGEFAKPRNFTPAAIVIIEGLHTLYPENLPSIDFGIYVDPERDIKWDWKYRRDIRSRGHKIKRLKEEMLAREAAYKKWVDFQKTNADVVVKIKKSEMKKFSRYELLQKQPKNCYKVELIVKATKITLPSLSLPLDLAALFNIGCEPFLLATVPSLYWGKKVSVIHIDGQLSKKIIKSLDSYLTECTGINPNGNLKKYEKVTATHFTQLLVTWRFLQETGHYIK